MSETIVLIHGLWMTPLSWEKWIDHYTAKGHKVVAPSWPGMEGGVEALRKDATHLEKLSIRDVVDSYTKVIEGLDRPPIIMGHSFGGLFTQLLIDRGLGSAGVALDSAPVKGILLLPFSTLKVSAPVLGNPLNFNRVGMLTPEQFHYAFTNTLSAEESLKVYNRYAVPGVDHLLFQDALANFDPHAETVVNFKNSDRAPLLLATGELDHIAPPSLIKMNYELYRKNSKALTEYKEFPGRTHYILGQDGWEEVADYVLDWAMKHSRAGAGA